jgi:plasmid stabilization system protein ParE
MKIRFLSPARDEFLAAVDFYEEQAAGLGADFTTEVEQALTTIASVPHLGTRYLESTRRLVVRRFPYNIVYFVESKAVVIVAVAHQRQKPGYWKDRD